MGFFGGGGASVDLASPPAIGNTTPNTGAFTTLSVSNSISSTSTLNWHYRIGGSSALSGIGSQYNLIKFFSNNNETIAFSSTEIYFSKNFSQDSSQYIGWASDTKLFRDGAANALAQRNGTTAQTFRLYRTFTDASNYERLGFIATRTTRFAIAAENAGTGAARSLEISFYTSASDPASTDITDGCFSVWKNSGTGTIKLWANDGGTMKSVALA